MLVAVVFVSMALVALAAIALTLAFMNWLDPGHNERRRQRISLDREAQASREFAVWALHHEDTDLAFTMKEHSDLCDRLRDLVPFDTMESTRVTNASIR